MDCWRTFIWTYGNFSLFVAKIDISWMVNVRVLDCWWMTVVSYCQSLHFLNQSKFEMQEIIHFQMQNQSNHCFLLLNKVIRVNNAYLVKKGSLSKLIIPWLRLRLHRSPPSIAEKLYTNVIYLDKIKCSLKSIARKSISFQQFNDFQTNIQL